jgi:hypothetical protein
MNGEDRREMARHEAAEGAVADQAEAGTGSLTHMGQHGRDLGGSRAVEVWSWRKVNRRRRSG